MFKIHKKPLTYRNIQPTLVLYSIPLGELLQMDKSHLRRLLSQTVLASRWLEGVLKVADELDRKGE